MTNLQQEQYDNLRLFDWEYYDTINDEIVMRKYDYVNELKLLNSVVSILINGKLVFHKFRNI